MEDHEKGVSKETQIQAVPKKIVIGTVIRESWVLVNGLKWPIFWLYLVIAPIFFILVFGITTLFTLKYGPPSLLILVILLSSISFFNWCLLTIAIMLGIRQAVSLSIKLSTVFEQIMSVKLQLFYLFLVWLAIIGLFSALTHFLVLRGIVEILFLIISYLASLYFSLSIIIFALPLTIIKHEDLQTALVSSFKMMNRYWLEIITCYLIISIIILISAIPFGIGLIWTMPMKFAMIGILFRNAYGLKVSVQK